MSLAYSMSGAKFSLTRTYRKRQQGSARCAGSQSAYTGLDSPADSACCPVTLGKRGSNNWLKHCDPMRLLLIHPEAGYVAGAETMLLYYLEGLMSAHGEVAVAVAKEGTFAGCIPNRVEQIQITDNVAFSIAGLRRQIAVLTRQHRRKPFDIIHGWAARDWELAALLGHWVRRPTVGTLH